MEYNGLVDTSLDLNNNPLRVYDDDSKQEMHANLIEFGNKMLKREEGSGLVEELNRVSAENQKLTEMLTIMCEDYNALRNQLMEYKSKKNLNTDEMNIISSTGWRKRKAENFNGNINMDNNINGDSDQSYSSDHEEYICKKPKEEHIKAKVSRVCVQTEASNTSLIVKDGYQWRKYGQKVTRDNPCPRAYFKCSFAPSCPVKKKVQRSVEDQSILVATYEGEHNHPHNSKLEATSSTTRSVTLGSVPCSTSHTSSGHTITLDLTKSKSNGDLKTSNGRNTSPVLQQFLVEQMASSLSKDPSFRAALAAAVSGKLLQPNQRENW